MKQFLSWHDVLHAILMRKAHILCQKLKKNDSLRKVVRHYRFTILQGKTTSLDRFDAAAATNK